MSAPGPEGLRGVVLARQAGILALYHVRAAFADTAQAQGVLCDQLAGWCELLMQAEQEAGTSPAARWTTDTGLFSQRWLGTGTTCAVWIAGLGSVDLGSGVGP